MRNILRRFEEFLSSIILLKSLKKTTLGMPYIALKTHSDVLSGTAIWHAKPEEGTRGKMCMMGPHLVNQHRLNGHLFYAVCTTRH